MRGILFIILLLVFGCTSQEVTDNVTNVTKTNDTNITNVTCTGPVCGSDGNTYLTDCNALAANITEFTQGKCDKTFTDFCINETELLEYTCLDNEVANTSISCNCQGGKCVEPEPAVDLGCEGPIQPDIYKAENATINGTVSSDICIDFTTVKDFYCKDNVLKAANSQCPAGWRCNLGACEEVIAQCTETDLGADIYTRGRTVVSKGMYTPFNKWDECDDQGTLIEHYCGIEGSVTQEIECGSGYMCSGGRCIESDCSETDDGFDIYKKGRAEIDEQEEVDRCINDYKLREYYCYGNSIENDDINCPEDHICDNERCVEGSIT
jgi:hypothetical protein